MKKSNLKSFDIATYDVEIEYNKKIAPFEKQIVKLDEKHETKSLKAHKDFLTKEKKSKDKLQELDEKQVLKFQRIEKAVENKLVKLRKKDQTIKNELNEYKKAQNVALKQDLDVINDRIKELNTLENADKQIIIDKYKKNVESYVEKLETYNGNFENNKKIFTEQYAKYNQILDDSLERIDNLKEENDKVVKEVLENYIKLKEDENVESNNNLHEIEKRVNRDVINIRKASNVKTTLAKNYVETLKDQYEKRYKTYIENLTTAISKLKSDFEVRKELINKDLEINLGKVETELESLGEKKPKKIVKSINKKKELFLLRAEAIISYEEQIHNEKVVQLESQVDKFKENLENELLNLDKLAVFLVNDQDQLKDTGEYFKTLNLELKQELVNSELANNEYLVKNEKLKTEFINNYTMLFNNIKRRLIDANKSQIDQLTTINAELDDINKFLDTVEPLKEIELNKLRESIEVSEIEERYKIKYAKEDHETRLLNNNTKKLINLEEIRVKTLLSENNKDITDIKNKEILDKAEEQAKLKYNKASEVYNLRVNSTKLERNILKLSYENELQKADINKELVRIQTEKKNVLLEKEIQAQIENIKIEADYKEEVINKRLEEDLLKLQENVGKITYERDAYVTSINQLIASEEQKIDREIIAINTEMNNKLSLIDEALSREIKEPSLSIARSEVIIKERLQKFVTNTNFINEYIEEVKESFKDETLSIDQQKQLAVKNKVVFDKVKKYVDNTYECLTDAVSFMNELEERSLLNKISSTADQGATKKLQKQLTKFENEKKKQLQTITASKEDHKNRLITIIKGNFQKLSKLKNISEESLHAQVNTIYTSLKKQLESLQNNIKSEVEQLYLPLTKKDQETLDNANSNAVKARNLVEKEREMQVAPINVKLGNFIKDKEEEKQSVVDGYNRKINDLNASINSIKNEALEKVKVIHEEIKELITVQEEQLKLVRSNEQENIEKQINEIASNKIQLEESYVQKLALLDEKDEEAKKIFEYEERIYNIALETARSRFNDSSMKTLTAHELQLKEAQENVLIVENNAEKNIDRINKELVEATNEFEKNIFTVRPKFEESIGDAQRAIDAEQEEKEKRRIELLELNQHRTEAIENSLYTSFKEAYEKLSENLANYLEKYKIIESEYHQSINEANEVINKNFDNFKNALFEVGETKINKTRENLLIINKKIN